jgi:hypothetical protein
MRDQLNSCREKLSSDLPLWLSNTTRARATWRTQLTFLGTNIKDQIEQTWFKMDTEVDTLSLRLMLDTRHAKQNFESYIYPERILSYIRWAKSFRCRI